MFRNLNIGSKLSMGFGLLVVLTLLVAGWSYYASNAALEKINRTDELRIPVALASAQAHTNLLRMFGNVRGYLALGDQQFATSYLESEQSFREALVRLETLSPGFSPENQERLEELQQAFERWTAYPETLMELRDDQMAREPAYSWLNTTGTELAGTVLININEMIHEQADLAPSSSNNELLEDMADFQSSFAAMVSGLRGYVMTRNPNFRFYEYDLNAQINTSAWERMLRQQDRLSPEQQARLAEIEASRQQFIQQIPEEVFTILQTENYEWREDLYLFTTEVTPLTTNMQRLLSEMTESQQQALQHDLNEGRNELENARRLTFAGGVVAVVLGAALSLSFWSMIAGPVRRLTAVASQIRGGDLEIQARIESGDEIGIFAETFNQMTTQLRDTLLQIQREKKRADDLLNVVIPIGVALSSERDFNRMLENMLLEAMSFCHADGGLLFLHKEKTLQLVMVRNESQDIQLGGTSDQAVEAEPFPLYDSESGEPNQRFPAAYATIHNTSVNIANTAEDDRFDHMVTPAVIPNDYRATSLLAIPLENNEKEVLGILQLINARETDTDTVVPFDANLQQMMESFSSLATAALVSYIREQGLRQEIQQLRIEIDEAKRQKEVSEIVDTDFFQDLRSKARSLRQRGGKGQTENPDDQPE